MLTLTNPWICLSPRCKPDVIVDTAIKDNIGSVTHFGAYLSGGSQCDLSAVSLGCGPAGAWSDPARRRRAGGHRPRISVAAIQIRISHGCHRLMISVADPDYKFCFFACGLILKILNLTFTCFACAGVTEKLSFQNFGNDILLFGDQNTGIKDM